MFYEMIKRKRDVWIARPDCPVRVNGTKTNKYWNGTIACSKKPLRIRLRNICGDETVVSV